MMVEIELCTGKGLLISYIEHCDSVTGVRAVKDTIAHMYFETEFGERSEMFIGAYSNTPRVLIDNEEVLLAVKKDPKCLQRVAELLRTILPPTKPGIDGYFVKYLVESVLPVQSHKKCKHRWEIKRYKPDTVNYQTEEHSEYKKSITDLSDTVTRDTWENLVISIGNRISGRKFPELGKMKDRWQAAVLEFISLMRMFHNNEFSPNKAIELLDKLIRLVPISKNSCGL